MKIQRTTETYVKMKIIFMINMYRYVCMFTEIYCKLHNIIKRVQTYGGASIIWKENSHNESIQLLSGALLRLHLRSRARRAIVLNACAAFANFGF